MGFKAILLYYSIYLAGVATFLIIIADPFTMSTYFSDNSLLPGLANREFSLSTEAEYYLRDMKKLTINSVNNSSMHDLPGVVNFIKQEIENFGLDAIQQSFAFPDKERTHLINGTNIYTIIRGERSTSSESVTICIPFKSKLGSNLPGVALGMALTKYFSTKSYWAKDIIILFVDHYEIGTSVWLDSYHDIHIQSQLGDESQLTDMTLKYQSLPERSGPMQSAIVLELLGREFVRLNVKVQGSYGQLPNLDLFNLVIDLAARESITPYFHGKSLPFDLSPQDLYVHHLETAISFMKTQATMKSDGLHGYFLEYSVQSLTLEAPEYVKANSKSYVMTSTLLNMGRLLEGIFRSLNNLTERFNRSYYFYIILSLRRFTSIGYYMMPIGLMISPLLLKTLEIYNCSKVKKTFGVRSIILLSTALALSLISTFNISAALMASVAIVPILIPC